MSILVVESTKRHLTRSRYICEISPTRHRGALATGPQLLITIGLVVGFFTCYGTANLTSSFSWRLPFILLACYSFVFSAVTLSYLPPSPRWLTLHGSAADAAAAWERLDVPAADREKIMTELQSSAVLADAHTETLMDDSLQRSTTLASRRSHKKNQMLDVFSSDSRPRLILAVFLMAMQQLSGIDGVLYVSPLLTPIYPPLYISPPLTNPPQSTPRSSSTKQASPPTPRASSPRASPPS
jgi:MFS family permease